MDIAIDVAWLHMHARRGDGVRALGSDVARCNPLRDVQPSAAASRLTGTTRRQCHARPGWLRGQGIRNSGVWCVQQYREGEGARRRWEFGGPAEMKPGRRAGGRRGRRCCYAVGCRWECETRGAPGQVLLGAAPPASRYRARRSGTLPLRRPPDTFAAVGDALRLAGTDRGQHVSWWVGRIKLYLQAPFQLGNKMLEAFSRYAHELPLVLNVPFLRLLRQ